VTGWRRRRFVVAAVVALAAIGIGVGAAVGGGGNDRKSPKVLNKPTDARRPRVLRPGPQPGFGRPELEREKHAE
jgi:hypothetical protein